jgi:hypothetical protein
MPSAIGMGSHFILVFLSAELSRDLKDSFLWKFCLSHAGRVEEKVRDGTERRACRCVGVWNRGRRGAARMSWREQEDAMVMYYALATMRVSLSGVARRGDEQFPSQRRMTAKASRGGKINFLGRPMDDVRIHRRRASSAQPPCSRGVYRSTMSIASRV